MLRLFLWFVGISIIFLATIFVAVFGFGINVFIVSMTDFPGGMLTISDNEYDISAGDHIRFYILPVRGGSQFTITCGSETDGNAYMVPEAQMIVFARTKQCQLKSYRGIFQLLGATSSISAAREKCEAAIEQLTGHDLGWTAVVSAKVFGHADRGTVTIPFSEAGQQRTAVCVFARDKPTRVTLDGKLFSGN